MARFTHPNDADIAGPAGPRGEKGETGATGATGPQGPKGDAGGLGGKHGAWYDTQTQIVNAVSVGQPVLLRQIDVVNGMSVVDNSKITASVNGTYNLAFSFQFKNEGGGGNGQTVEIWLVKNGIAVPESNTRIAVNTNSPYVVAAWNFFKQLNTNDYMEIYWATDNRNIVMKYNTGAMGGPTIPSAIITVNQIA
jgi:hypothetical protein